VADGQFIRSKPTLGTGSLLEQQLHALMVGTGWKDPIEPRTCEELIESDGRTGRPQLAACNALPL
jgi:hypothetical protein